MVDWPERLELDQTSHQVVIQLLKIVKMVLACVVGWFQRMTGALLMGLDDRHTDQACSVGYSAHRRDWHDHNVTCRVGTAQEMSMVNASVKSGCNQTYWLATEELPIASIRRCDTGRHRRRGRFNGHAFRHGTKSNVGINDLNLIRSDYDGPYARESH